MFLSLKYFRYISATFGKTSNGIAVKMSPLLRFEQKSGVYRHLATLQYCINKQNNTLVFTKKL
jgi:hypothetical protein